MATKANRSDAVLNRLADVVREASHYFGASGASGPFEAFFRLVRDRLGVAYPRKRAAEDFALAVVAVRWLESACKDVRRSRWRNVVEFACRHPVCRCAWEAACDLSQEVSTDATPTAYFLEDLLARIDPQRRRETGVYFTPQPLASYLVRQADAVLRERFAAADGLASPGFPVHIVDPAMGSGVFPLQIVRHLRQARMKLDGDTPAMWSGYVSDCLLPRLHGYEISPAPFVLANFLVAQELIAGGYTPSVADRLQFHLADTLAEPRVVGEPNQVVVVIGNPPYRSAARDAPPWLANLMRGVAPSDAACASYYHVDGQPLGERKHWLHDDYVKFIRWAQWQVECAGAGAIAPVANHGFLDNPTFRGMRCGLMQTFAEIELVDLQGNSNKFAQAQDESVFATAQGMATLVAWRTQDANARCSVRRGDLHGSRQAKLTQLGDERAFTLQPLHPHPPYYFFCAHDTQRDDEYARGFAITEIMPVSTTAAVTARDKLVIDIDRDELVRRLAMFCDLRISDDEIRRRYFPAARTAKYPPGDTRGWKLADARRRLAGEDDWQRHIRRCWYRPFDRRWILWMPWMIDWPRQEVMRHFNKANVALVCRRQMVRGRPCNFFWAADDIVIDGYIRSDNRGSESVFPLHLYEDGSLPGFQQTPNFTTEFSTAVAGRVACEFTAGEAASDGQFDARDLFHYIYAAFHSNSYRERYTAQLCIDFPRVPLPASRAMFRRLAEQGARLVAMHTMHNRPHSLKHDCFAGSDDVEIGPVNLGGARKLAPSLDDAAWNFQVGAHQVLRKWLKDRRARKLSAAEVATYRRMAQAVQGTLDAMREIDRIVQTAGGWAACFQAP